MYLQFRFSYIERLDLIKQCLNGWNFQTTQQGELCYTPSRPTIVAMCLVRKRIGDLGVRYIIANNTYLQPQDRKGARLRILQ